MKPDKVDAEATLLELQVLREEVSSLRRKNRLLLGGYRAGGAIFALIVLGPSLVKAARQFVIRSGAKEPLPPTETADLLAAIVRRTIAVGALGLLVASVPAFLLAKQNGLIEEQNEYFREQNEKIQTQLLIQTQENKRQQDDTLLVRRNELLRTIYEAMDCGENSVAFNRNPCPPIHPIRLRQEAARALAWLDGMSLDLRFADLKEANLSSVNWNSAELYNINLATADLREASLSRANLYFADLSESNLAGADLTEAILSHSDLEGSYLIGADLSNALLMEASLSDAKLFMADLRGSRLFGTNLNYAKIWGADFRGSSGLTQDTLLRTCGDLGTLIPENLVRPSHWLQRRKEQGDPPDAGCPPRT